MPGRFKGLSQGGFTVIEILIVLTVVLIVAVLVANNIQESAAKGRDIERRVDIDTIQDALEEYWHANEHYPASLAVLGIDEGTLTDPTGNLILTAPASESANKPASGYAQAQPDQEYTYAPYQCASQAAENEEPTEGETTETDAEATAGTLTQVCQKYVLYSWLEKAETSNIPYEQNNFHSPD